METQENGYVIAEANNPSDLVDRVNELMQSGWRPVGGPLIYQGVGARIVLQALLRVESLRQ
jgi:hypothetical protein